LVELRFLPAFASVVTLSAREFFVEAGLTGEGLEKLMDA